VKSERSEGRYQVEEEEEEKEKSSRFIN